MLRSRSLLLIGRTLSTAAALSTTTLEPLGATHRILRPLEVYSTSGDAVPLATLLPSEGSDQRCVVAMLRHFG